MNRRITKVAWITSSILGLALVACGGDGDKELLIEDFAQAYSAEFCGKLYKCCDQQELTDLQGSQFTDELSCTTYFSDLTQQYIVTPMQQAITAGRGEYNAATAANCLDAYEQRGCAGAAENDLSTLQGACADFYVGLQPTDSPCASALECTDGHYCLAEVCTAFAAENAECTAGETMCAAGLFCDGSHCVPRLSAGSQCISSAQCQAGLTCDQASGECEAPEPICDGQ